MRSNPRQHPGEAPSSLEESSYEVLSESVFDASDDEGHTESLASTDGYTPDDVSSISDGDEFDDDYMDDASQHFSPSHPETADDPLNTQITSPDGSTFTELADKELSESSHLRLEETVDNIGACGLIKEFDQTSGVPDILRPYGCPEVKLTVRMGLSERFLSVSGSYRILYIGNLPDWAEKDVCRQIGTALDAPPSSSRFNIVRGQLEPSGPALDVDHCTTLEFEQESHKSSCLRLTLDDGTQLSFGPGKATRVQGSASLPDLVIFYHETSKPTISDAASGAEKFRVARRAFERHQIPSLDVALTRPFGQCPEAFAFDTNSLRLCVEGRKYQDSEYEIQENLPIDIYDFIKIEPSQLNRHLAYIKSCAVQSDARCMDGEKRSWSSFTRLPNLGKGATYLYTMDRLIHRILWTAIIPLTAILLAYLWTSVFTSVVTKELPQVQVHSLEPSSACMSTTTTASMLKTSLTVTVPSTSVGRIPIPQDPTIATSKEQSSIDQRRNNLGTKWQGGHRREEKFREEISRGFEIQVIGDHQFLLQPFNKLADGKRNPHLDIRVSQHSKNVPIWFNPTSGIVTLTNKYQSGVFDVTVVSRPKPLLEQSFRIQLGSQKSHISCLRENVARLSQAVKHDLSLAHSNLQDLKTAVAKRIQARVIQYEDAVATLSQTRSWRQQAHESTQSVAGHLEEARKRAVHQLSIGTNVTRDLSKIWRRNLQNCASRASNLALALQDARMLDLWKFTRPVRTSQAVLKARRNALLLQRKVQTKFKKRKVAQDGLVLEKKPCKRGKQCRKAKPGKEGAK